MINRLFNQVNLLEKGLDASWKKNEVIANNIANVDTEGFKASHVSFESVFRDFLDTDARPFLSTENEYQSNVSSSDSNPSANPYSNILEPQITTDQESEFNIDGNGVDIDSEMSELTKNAILYDTMTYALNKELNRLKIILNEGR